MSTRNQPSVPKGEALALAFLLFSPSKGPEEEPGVRGPVYPKPPTPTPSQGLCFSSLQQVRGRGWRVGVSFLSLHISTRLCEIRLIMKQTVQIMPSV